MKYKIKPKFLKIFKNTDFIGVFDLANSSLPLTALNSDISFFETWLKNNKHAGMKFLEKNLDARKNPAYILDNVKTAIVFLFPYAHGHRVRRRKELDAAVKPRDDNLQAARFSESLYEKKLISKYTYAKDYHKTIKKKLIEYAEALQKDLNQSFDYRPVVDSIPFFERAHARETGLGFIGKNTLLIRPGIGSFFFIGTLLTSLDVSIFADLFDKKNPIFSLSCGDCRKCLDACPTQALEEKFTLNANKCLSYLTIEHRDIIETKYLNKLNKTIYGCDICQDVCPYNFVTQDVSMLNEFKKIHPPLLTLTAEEIATMTEIQYQTWFGGTAMTRAKYEGLVRNALYYLFANKHETLSAILQNLSSSSYPLIQKTVQQLISESKSL